MSADLKCIVAVLVGLATPARGDEAPPPVPVSCAIDLAETSDGQVTLRYIVQNLSSETLRFDPRRTPFEILRARSREALPPRPAILVLRLDGSRVWPRPGTILALRKPGTLADFIGTLAGGAKIASPAIALDPYFEELPAIGEIRVLGMLWTDRGPVTCRTEPAQEE